MAEICPFRVIAMEVCYCHDGHPSYSDEFPSEHTCKAWGIVGKGNVCEEIGDKMGCKLIERQ